MILDSLDIFTSKFMRRFYILKFQIYFTTSLIHSNSSRVWYLCCDSSFIAVNKMAAILEFLLSSEIGKGGNSYFLCVHNFDILFTSVFIWQWNNAKLVWIFIFFQVAFWIYIFIIFMLKFMQRFYILKFTCAFSKYPLFRFMGIVIREIN